MGAQRCCAADDATPCRVDVDLAMQDGAEAQGVRKLMRDACDDLDVGYTSRLERAIRTMWFVLDAMGRMRLFT